MDILSNIEVRWFLDDIAGADAAAARRWFAGVPSEGPREDRYLLTGRDDIGFKARVQEGRPAKLETKYLLGSLGPALLHDRFVGNLERWQKLSLDASDPSLEQRGHWVKLTKERRLRKFACAGRAVRAMDLSSRAEAGCLIELTEVRYDVEGEERRALTIGVDAFGPTERLLDVLLRVCETALEPAQELRLGVERSDSYPRWLQRVVASAEAAAA